MSTDAELGASPETPVGPDPTAAPSPTMEKAVAFVALAIGLAIVVGARNIVVRNETGGIDPRWWPTAIGGAVVAAAGWMILNAFTGRRGERDVEPATRSGWRQMAIAVGLTTVVIAIWWAGLSFIVLAPVYVIGLSATFGLRDLKSLVLFPAGLTVFLYLVFQLLLGVPL